MKLQLAMCLLPVVVSCHPTDATADQLREYIESVHGYTGVEGTYDRWSYLPERRDALEKLATLIDRIIHPGENVLTLRRA